jgi:hypothetical protein
MIRITKRFYDDHVERDLEAPAVLRSSKRYYWIDTEDKDFVELHTDAIFYRGMWLDGAFDSYLKPICMSAHQLITAYEKSAPIGVDIRVESV